MRNVKYFEFLVNNIGGYNYLDNKLTEAIKLLIIGMYGLAKLTIFVLYQTLPCHVN